MAETSNWVKEMFKEEFEPSLHSLAKELICEMEHYCPEELGGYVRCWMTDEEEEKLISYFVKSITRDIKITNSHAKQR